MNEPQPGGDIALEPARFRARAWLAPGLVLLGLVVLLALVIFIAGRSGGSGAPPPAGPFDLPANPNATLVYDVQQVSGDGRITFADGASVAVPAGARVERLTPIEPGDIEVGEAIAFLGEPNTVRNFALTTIMLYGEGAALAEDEGIVRSAGGFEGWEVLRNGSVRTVVAGTVESFDGASMVVDTAAGPMTVTLLTGEGLNRYPIFRIDESDVSTIRSGERVVFPAVDGAPDENAGAVLVGQG